MHRHAPSTSLTRTAQRRSRSTSGSDRNQGGQLHPRVALAAVTASRAAGEGVWHDELEPPRPARRALATLPGQLSRYPRSAQFLSRMSRDEQGALRCRRLAGTALLVPQGVAPAMVHRPARDRCAALAARIRGCLSAAECVLPRASQDRARGPVRVSPPPWPLSTPTLRAAHGYMRLVGVVRRSEERGRDARDRLGVLRGA